MSKKLTDEELFAQFEGIDSESAPPDPPLSKPSTTIPNQPPPNPDDLFLELGIPERPKPTSRPHTPKIPSTSTTPGQRSSPKRHNNATPPSSDATRSSEERAPLTRKSGDSTRSFHNSFTPRTDSNEGEAEHEPEKPAPQAQSSGGGGGGWWGGIFGAASAAVKQAEALAKEIQKNEEAQRWAEQVKGNVGALRGLGTRPFPHLGISSHLSYFSFFFPAPVHSFSYSSKTKSALTEMACRRRTPLTRPPNLYLPPPHPRPSNLFPRTAANPRDPRYPRLPLPNTSNAHRLLARNVASRRRGSARYSTRTGIHSAPLFLRLHRQLLQRLERWTLVA